MTSEASVPHHESSSPIPAAVASPKPKRLGRGLASLMSNTRSLEQPAPLPPAAPDRIDGNVTGVYKLVAADRAEMHPHIADKPLDIPTDRIRPNPYQPRRNFAESDLAELVASIRQQGILQPLLVVPDGDPGQSRFILVAGERRLRAASRAGLASVPCLIRQATPEQMLQWALIENIQRSDLNPVERAHAYRDYLDRFSATQQQLAEEIGEPRSTVANYLRILDLCDTVHQSLVSGKLSFGHAKVLASLAGHPEKQVRLAAKVLEEDLSVRQLEQLVAEAAGQVPADPTTKPKGALKSQHILDVERQLSSAVGTRVCIRPGRGKHTGRIIVDYYSLDDFDRIAASLGAKLES